MSPLTEIRSPWPARFGSVCAGLVVLVMALAACFIVLPPVALLPDDSSAPLHLPAIARDLWWIAGRADCGRGLAGLLAFDCRLAAAGRAVAGSPLASELFIRFMIIVIATVVSAWVAFDRIRAATPKADRAIHVRGRRLHQGAAARKSMRGQLAGIGRPDMNGLWLLPHVQLPAAAESYNILAIGTQGAGKTGVLRAWLEQLIERGDRVVVHDVKGDMTAGLPADRFVLLAPHDARSAVWDIARDIGDRTAALEFAARSIKAAQADSMWADGARALWADAIVSLALDHGRGWTLRHLYELLTSPPVQLRDALVRSGAASAELIAFDEVGGVQRTSMSLLITLWVAALTALKPLVDAWDDVPAGRRFSLSGWLKEESRLPCVIVIQKSAEYPELSALVGGLLVERLAGLVLSPDRKRDPERKIALVLDELAELGRLHRLPSLLSVGREAGVMTVAAVQDLGQLVEAYGETTARVLEARFGIKVIGRLSAGDTAERVSKVLIGERVVEFFERNPAGADRSQASLKRRETHPVFPVERMETELGVRSFRGKALIRCLVLGLGDPALVDVPFTAWPDRRAAHRPAAWLRGAYRSSSRPCRTEADTRQKDTIRHQQGDHATATTE